MSKQAFKRVRRALGLEVNREPLPAFAWPGGYPVVYVFLDGGSICPKCVNANIDAIDGASRGNGGRNSHGGWAVDSVSVHYEGEHEICDHCGKEIE